MQDVAFSDVFAWRGPDGARAQVHPQPLDAPGPARPVTAHGRPPTRGGHRTATPVKGGSLRAGWYSAELAGTSRSGNQGEDGDEDRFGGKGVGALAPDAKEQIRLAFRALADSTACFGTEGFAPAEDASSAAARVLAMVEAQLEHFGRQLGCTWWRWLADDREDCQEELEWWEAEQLSRQLRDRYKELKGRVDARDQPTINLETMGMDGLGADIFFVSGNTDGGVPLSRTDLAAFGPLKAELGVSHCSASEDEVRQKTRALLEESEAFMRRVLRQVHFPFQYKQRLHDGRAIHVAALHWEPQARLLQALLRLGADIGHRCPNISFGSKAIALPIHLAAGCGHVSLIKELLAARASAESKSTFAASAHAPAPVSGGHDRGDAEAESFAREEEVEHYTALHEAAFFGQVDAADALLKARADVNSRNKEGMTPLHVVAKCGSCVVAGTLLAHRADLTFKDLRGDTALEVAVDHGNFPVRKLYLLTRKRMEEILTVARISPSAAAELMRDPADETGNVHRSWREALAEEAKTASDVCGTWRELMRIAPQAAEDLLEALTCVPEVDNRQHHPLPRQALLRPGEVLRFHYTATDRWSYAATAELPEPTWHLDTNSGLAPQANRSEGEASRSRGLRGCCRAMRGGLMARCKHGVHGSRRYVRVQVKVVKIRNLICPEVFFVLKQTDHMHIFTKLGTKAMIDLVWRVMVKKFYYFQVFHRALEIAVLLWWVLSPPAGAFEVRLTWSFLFASACREALYEVLEMWGFLYLTLGEGERAERQPLLNFLAQWGTLGNLFDFLSILMLMVLTALAWGKEDQLAQARELLAGVVLSRWLQLMVALRAFSAIGQKLLPIFQSTMSMGGIFCVTAFCFMGFLHAFWSIGRPGMSNANIFIKTVTLLLSGDSGGMDMVLSLGQDQDDGEEHASVVSILLLVASLFLFCIWIMNLFISGTDQAYQAALEYAHTRFQQERASICLQCFLRPSVPWSMRCGVPPKAIRALQMLVVLPVWAYLLYKQSLQAWVPSAWLCANTVLFEALLIRHPSDLDAAATRPGFSRSDHQRYEDALTIGKVDSTDRMSGRTSPKTPTFGLSGTAPLDVCDLDVAIQPPAETLLPVPRIWCIPLPSQPSAASREKARTHDGAAVGMYLWICHRESYSEALYWPSEQANSEKLEGNVASIKRDAMFRAKRLNAEMVTLRRRQDMVSECLQVEAASLRGELALLTQKVDLLLGLASNASRVAAAASATTPAPTISPPVLSREVSRPQVSSQGTVIWPGTPTRAEAVVGLPR